HVNKVSSKIVLRFNVIYSSVLNEDEKQLILLKLANKLNKNNDLIVTCEESRSQHKNKEIAIHKLLALITSALKIPKKRKPTKKSKKANRKRLEKKAKHALKKQHRKKVKY
ncbi:MAG: peptide chain release factor-like protein, partial [Flavobacteriaceae bacterium]